MGKGKKEANRIQKAKASSKAKGTDVKGVRTGNLKMKGENFYRDKAKLSVLKMHKDGRPQRNRRGEIVKAASFLDRKPENAVARIEPNRKWFGNTSVIGQGELEKFREAIVNKGNDPYQVLLRQNRLPMSLLTDSTKASRMNLLRTESFAHTFGAQSQRKRPKLQIASVEEMLSAVGEKTDVYAEGSDKRAAEEAPTDFRHETSDPVFRKGQSKRIWGELNKVIDSSDVIVHVLDARDPMGTRCRNIEGFIAKSAGHKHLVFLLNKCDLVPPAVASRWVKVLSREFPTLAFHASITNPFGKGSLIQLLRQFSRLHADKKQISVGFVGYPNTGKSSIINTLRKKAVCSVAPIPGQTKVWQYVTLMKRIYLIDCPGVVPIATEDDDTTTVLKGVVRVENVRNPEDHVAGVLAKAKPEHLARTYDVAGWTDATDFLAKIAAQTGKLLRGGEPDLPTVAKMVLHDWIRGRIPYYVPPPPKTQGEPEEEAEDEAVADPACEEASEEEEEEVDGSEDRNSK
jgi:nuclear GTP-binding protein